MTGVTLEGLTKYMPTGPFPPETVLEFRDLLVDRGYLVWHGEFGVLADDQILVDDLVDMLAEVGIGRQ